MADSTKKLQDLGAEVAAQGSSEAIRALRDELLALGLKDEAAAQEKILAAREQKLAEAQAAREAEAQKAHAAAVDAARTIFEGETKKYVAARDEAIEALAAYADNARTAMPLWESVVKAHTALRMLIGDGVVELPELATAIVQRDERF